MTFETYDPTKHTLEVGTKIRLAGREGEITGSEQHRHWVIYWLNWDNGRGIDNDGLYLELFPLLEIAVSPLTIDKRVKGALVDIYNGPHDHETTLRMIYNYLNSLKET